VLIVRNRGKTVKSGAIREHVGGVFLHLNSHEMQISYFVWNHI
jgi:hypothetical protein